MSLLVVPLRRLRATACLSAARPCSPLSPSHWLRRRSAGPCLWRRLAVGAVAQGWAGPGVCPPPHLLFLALPRGLRPRQGRPARPLFPPRALLVSLEAPGTAHRCATASVLRFPRFLLFLPADSPNGAPQAERRRPLPRPRSVSGLPRVCAPSCCWAAAPRPAAPRGCPGPPQLPERCVEEQPGALWDGRGRGAVPPGAGTVAELVGIRIGQAAGTSSNLLPGPRKL